MSEQKTVDSFDIEYAKCPHGTHIIILNGIPITPVHCEKRLILGEWKVPKEEIRRVLETEWATNE